MYGKNTKLQLEKVRCRYSKNIDVLLVVSLGYERAWSSVIFSTVRGFVRQTGNGGGRWDLQFPSKTKKHWDKWTVVFKICSVLLRLLW